MEHIPVNYPDGRSDKNSWTQKRGTISDTPIFTNTTNTNLYK